VVNDITKLFNLGTSWEGTLLEASYLCEDKKRILSQQVYVI